MIKCLNKPSCIVIVFLCALIPKIYFLALSYNNNVYTPQKAYYNGDASHYLKIAKNIYVFGVFSDNNSKMPTESATWRSPFWPFVLASFFYLTNDLFGLIITKSIFEFMLLIVAFSLIRHIKNIKPVHFLFFLVLFIEPYYLKYSITFLSESLTSILILVLALAFVLFNESKKYSILIPLLSVIVMLCHPVSVFFVLTLLVIYGLINLKKHPIRIIAHAVLVMGLTMLWPLRNLQTFSQGFYLTASQGATFSKGWNEMVIDNYTNVDGDLADESLNLKHVENLKDNAKYSTLKLAKLYKEGTLNYIKSLSFFEAVHIAMVKLKSNFNPFPEKPKPGFLEALATVFRIFYGILFLQCLFRIFKQRKIGITSEKDKVFLVVFSILMGQILMSVFIYTGLRFNAIYGLTLLFSFIYVNKRFFIPKKEKWHVISYKSR